jgi:hypothetical protein
MERVPACQAIIMRKYVIGPSTGQMVATSFLKREKS